MTGRQHNRRIFMFDLKISTPLVVDGIFDTL